MKVLASEKLASEGVKYLEGQGHTVDVKAGMTPEELLAAIPAYDALIVRSATQVTDEVLTAGKNLKIVGRAGIGTDNIDKAAAKAHGIIVCNAPTSNSVSAAEQAFALMLCVSRNTAKADASMQAGKWEKSKFTGHELYEKTLAIVGLGHIGSLIAKRAQAFEMKVIGYDPYLTADAAAKMGVELVTDLDELCKAADYITVHMPKTPETIGMFGAKQFDEMKPTVFLINDARGGIYDTAALVDALKAGKIGGAAIDVFESEPCTDSPLVGFPNVVLTPHLGASTSEAQTRAGVQISEFVAMGLAGKPVPTQVNK